MKIAFITTFYRDAELRDITRLKNEIRLLHITNAKWYVTDNRNNDKGYAAGINHGIKKALADKADIFVICNLDISIKNISFEQLFSPQSHFDIWGFSHRQNGKTYYGGEIDKWRMSGGLVDQKPRKKFIERDFVSGSFIFIKRKVIEEISLWDESYFLYYEEVDYCYRAKRAGFRIGIDSGNSYEHFEISNSVNRRKDFYLFKSHIKFFMKNANAKQKIREFFRLPKTFLEGVAVLYSYILYSTFLIDFFSLNLSSLIIKLTSFVNFLFLVKYLTAPEYGIYTLVWAQVSILSPLADFGTTSYGVVYLPSEKKQTYQSLINFRVVISLVVFIATVLLSLVLFKGSVKMYGYILVTATVIFTNMFSGSYFILNAVKSKLYRSSRNSIIFNILLVGAIAVSLMIYKRLLAVFVIIFLFYNAYSAINFLLVKKELQGFRFKFNIQEWMSIFRKLYVFVLISFFASLYSRIDVFLLKMLKGESEVGIYAAGSKFLEALLFIAASYNVTSTPILSRLSKNAKLLKQKITKDIVFLSFIGFGLVIAILIFSPYILTYIFRKNYLLSIPVLKIVIFALPFILLNSIWINTLYVLKKSYLVIFVFLSQAVINIGLNLFFIPRYSYIASSYITVFSEVMNCVVLFILLRYVWKKNYENIN